MLSEMELRNDYRKYFTLSTVSLGHLLVVYTIWNTNVQAPMATAVPKNTINIHFLASKKNDIQPFVDSSANHPVPKNRQKTEQPAEFSASSKATKIQDSKISVISTNTAQKIVIPLQKNESKQQTQQRNTIQSEKVAVNIKSNPEKNLQMSEPDMSIGVAAIPAESISSDSKAVAQNSKRQSESSSVSTVSEKAPIPVSRVDVLSLGKLIYDDRELQNQQRLVVLTIQINAKGLPINIHVKQSSGLDSLDERAIRAIQKSKFKPHKVNGEAVPVIVNFPIQLKLSRNR